VTQSRQLTIEGSSEPHSFRGGCTLIIDLSKVQIQYAIVKNIDSQNRADRTAAFLTEAMQDPFGGSCSRPVGEPFAALHSLADVTS